jgi:hypothetical protein
MSAPSEIDLPGVKEVLWQQMYADLRSFIPHFPDNEIMCPACFRHMKFEELSLEHIIPRQAVDCDPIEVREAITRNQRSGLTLLCTKPLVWKGRRIKGNGCNSWKGRYFDGFVRKLLHAHPHTVKLASRHQISIFAIGYLALFAKYGYRISLSSDGLLMRTQFFNPNSFVGDIPMRYKMILAGLPLTELDDHNRTYWSDPFKITIERGAAWLVIRSMSFCLPLSSDPTRPIARALRYAPPKYKFQPNLETAFE